MCSFEKINKITTCVDTFLQQLKILTCRLADSHNNEIFRMDIVVRAFGTTPLELYVVIIGLSVIFVWIIGCAQGLQLPEKMEIWWCFGAEYGNPPDKEAEIMLLRLDGARKVITEVIRAFLECRNYESEPFAKCIHTLFIRIKSNVVLEIHITRGGYALIPPDLVFNLIYINLPKSLTASMSLEAF